MAEVQPFTDDATYRINRDKDAGLPPELIHPRRRHRKYVACCGCLTALILLLVVIFLVLYFAIFTNKSPRMTINSLQFEGLDRINWTHIIPATNLTMIADVAVKNPNIATFKFENATTVISYDGSFIGVAESPHATIKAGGILRFSVIMNVNIFNVSRLQSDYLSGMLPLNSYTRVSGKVKVFNVIKRDFLVRTNCTTRVNVTSYLIVEQRCHRKANM